MIKKNNEELYLKIYYKNINFVLFILSRKKSGGDIYLENIWWGANMREHENTKRV